MKKLWLFMLSLVALSVISCSKNTASSDSFAQSLSKATLDAISKPTVIEIRQAYSLLSDKEKQTLWVVKYDKILSEPGLSSDQYQVVTKLKNFLVTNGFVKISQNPEIGQDFIKSNLAAFEKVFSNEQLYLLIECAYYSNTFEIKNAQPYLASFLANLNTQLKKTDVDDPDNPPNLPPKCTCLYNISCPGDYNTCDEKKCTKIAECGLFGTSNCTGKCSLDQ